MIFCDYSLIFIKNNRSEINRSGCSFHCQSFALKIAYKKSPGVVSPSDFAFFLLKEIICLFGTSLVRLRYFPRHNHV